jgi:hypothetical protein
MAKLPPPTDGVEILTEGPGGRLIPCQLASPAHLTCCAGGVSRQVPVTVLWDRGVAGSYDRARQVWKWLRYAGYTNTNLDPGKKGRKRNKEAE